jgi:hypothetical protein
VSGLVVAVALLEGGLQGAAFFQWRAARERLRSDAGDGRPVVAFVGDSNMYGLYVEPHETLAKRVEALSRAGGARGVATVNLAMPGAPSWTVLEQVRRAASLGVVAIVARCGINNFSSVPPGGGFGIFENLRVVKMLHRLYFNMRWKEMDTFELPSGPGGEVIKEGGKRIDDERAMFLLKARDGGQESLEIHRKKRSETFATIEPRYRADLAAMQQIARDRGARLLLASYMSGAKPGFSDLRDAAASVAAEHGILVVDTASIPLRAAEYYRTVPCPERPALGEIAGPSANGLLLTLDDHPTASGYAAEAVLVVEQLAKAGILPSGGPPDPLSVLPKPAAFVPTLRQGRAASLAFLYEGKPQDRLQILLGTPGSFDYKHTMLPLDPVSWRRGALPENEMAAVADGAGRARIAVPESLQKIAPAKLRAIAVVRRGGTGGASQVLLSEPVDVVR